MTTTPIFKVGDHVFYWLYYRHHGLNAYQRKEALGRVMEAYKGFAHKD
jgi:hypothetical protein